ncbi:MAG TPA: hypothetical protein EYP85_15250 [Armatimonadetes bacterium]|nr:hypothetical protein [Armatimonadota bacterium]
METEVPLPFKEPGVYAVAVSATPGPERGTRGKGRASRPGRAGGSSTTLESTVVVMITDLGLICKATRRDLLVFTENLRTQEPFGGVQVLVSDGNTIFATGQTDENGVWHAELPELRPASQVKVLALSGTHFASTENDLQGVQFAPGLAPKAFLYTDRPLYRPGQTVHLRGIVRKVEHGRYTFTPGEEFTQTVLAPDGTVIHTARVKLNAFGTYSDQFPLPPEAPVGTYRIRLVQRKPVRLSFEGAFEVATYELPKIQLTIEVPRNTYLRGEDIEGKIVAQYYYGEPVAQREVRFGWDEEPGEVKTTDAQGEIAFTLPTRQFEEEQVVRLWARMEEENVAAARLVHIAVVGLRAQVSTFRRVYLVNEPFDLTVKLTDLGGDPVGKEVSVNLIKWERTERGEVKERSVATYPLTTDPQTGKGVTQVSVPEAGNYLFRLQTADAHGNPVSAETRVRIVGEDDEVKLRFLTDTDTFQVGAEAQLTLVSRSGARLALLTYEGERIYGYQIVRLQPGPNKITLRMTPELAPNFNLVAAAMAPPPAHPAPEEPTTWQFHTATKALQVELGLRVTVASEKSTYRPGERVRLRVQTTDQNGRPLPAELSLAAVDEALFAVHPDPTPDLGSFFYQRELAKRAVVTQTSCTFHYSAEAQRRVLLVKEQERRIPLAMRVPLLGAVPVMGELFARRGFGGFGGWAADMVARFQGPRGPAGPPGPQAGAMPGVPPPSPPVAEEVAVEEKALLARRPRPTAPAPIPAVRAFFPETAFWNAHLVTDEKGQARVEFELPDTITKWVLVARGVTVETLAGEERASLVTRQPFLVELKLPTVFQQGDTVFVTAELRNNTEEELRATATLSVGPAALPSPPGRASGAGVAGGGPTTISIAPHSTQELAFRVEVPAGRELPLSLEVTTDRGLADAVRHSVPIRPWGQEHFDAEGGTAADDRLVWLELPPAEYQWKDLHITVGPSLERALLDAVLLPPVIIRPWARVEVNLQFAPCVSNLPARAQAVLAAMAYLRQLNRTEVPEYRRLAQELEALVARLAATQNQDGGWSWAQRGKQSDPFVSAAAVAVWAQARRLGLPVPAEALGKALAYLQNAFQRAAETDYPLKVAILQAQAAAGRVDFGPLNRLYRLRAGLDTRSLAVLMSLLADLERVPMARDLEPLLRERIKHLDGQAHCEAAKTPLRWGGDAVETTALALLALSKIHAGASVRPPVLNKLAEWLWAQRIGNTWPTPTATAAAVTALAYYTALVPPAAEQYTLTVRVNDREVRRLKITGDTRTQTIAVPPELLPEARVKVAFDLEGRGQYAYNCQLVGFTEEIIPRSEEFYLRRKVLQPPRLFEGRPVPRGFSVVDASEGVKTWENLATQTPAGKQVVVRLDWHTQRDFRPGAYVVLWEPLPAGTRVLEETIRGSFERYVLGAAEITFFYRTHNRPWERGWAQFDLYGAFPGAYRVSPPRVWAAYQPQHYGLAPAGRLDVLRRDQPTTDQYRLTPDELYHLGTKHFERQDYAVAEGHLSTLFDQWKLRERPFKETARMLFHLALHRGDAARTVRFFELLRERYPTHVVPLSEIVKVAQAYRQLGEHEREVQVYRVTAAASFGQESRVAGVLEEEGEIAAAVEFMHHLALTYPDVPSTENALYTLGQFIYDRAAKLASQTRTSSRTWFDRALQQLRQFLVFYPVSPVADEASFTLANALLEQQRLAEAIAWSRRAQERYPQSVFRDDFEYIEAYAHFLNEEFEAALELCQRLAKGTYPRREGGQAPSDYRWLALYIAAQVFHSRNSPSEAVEYYRQVAHKFPDAQEALDYFQHTELRVPEVTVAQGEEPVRLKITTRNVPTAQVTVYRVDLLKFYQQHRSLQDLAKMNLAGVRPTLAREVTLSPERYVPQETTVELPLPETGAYFVMVKSGGLTATGILLRTNLALEVQEDPDSGRVRVNVINRAENKYEPRTEVWVVGSANEQFLKGQTDLRGVFVADDIRGTTTVVAWKAGQYAFYRGTKVLQPPAVRERARAERRRVPARKRAKFHEEALRGLRAGQAAIQQQRSRELEEQLKGGGFEAGGVQVQQAF